jgi:hypothetical protein
MQCLMIQDDHPERARRQHDDRDHAADWPADRPDNRIAHGTDWPHPAQRRPMTYKTVEVERVEPIAPEAYRCRWDDRNKLALALLQDGKGSRISFRPRIHDAKGITGRTSRSSKSRAIPRLEADYDFVFDGWQPAGFTLYRTGYCRCLHLGLWFVEFHAWTDRGCVSVRCDPCSP